MYGLPYGIDIITIAFAICLYWAWYDYYRTATGQQNFSHPNLNLIFVVFWVVILGLDMWMFMTGDYVHTPAQYFETFVLFNFLVVSILEFNHADRETLGIPQSL